VLTPGLARVLPGSLTFGFQVVAFVSLWLTGAVAYAIGRRLGFGRAIALAGMFLFYSLGWAVKFNLHDFWLSDPPAFLFAALAILCLLDRRDLAFAGCLVVGVLAKESVIFVAPLAYTLRAAAPFDRRALIRAAGLAMPAILVLGAIRLAIPSYNADAAYRTSLPRAVQPATGKTPSYTLPKLLRSTLALRKHEWPQTAAKALSAFGLLPLLLPFAGGRRTLSLLARLSPFLILCFAQLLFAGNTQRVVVFAFPAVIAMAMSGASRLVEHGGIPAVGLLALAAAEFALALIWPTEWMPGLIPQAALVLALVALTLGLRRFGRPSTGSGRAMA
jgi:hypothetical protein